MAKYKAYPEYKDSGIESLDTIPKMWSIKKLKYIFEIKKRIAGKIGFDVLSVTQKGIKIKDIESGEGQLSMDYSKYQRVYSGEFAMNHMDLLTGYVDISNYDGVTSPDYRVFAVRDKHSFYSRYYLYLLQDGYKQRRFFHLGQGSAHLGRWRLPTEAFNEIVYPCPSLTEQIYIASFLDHETAKIDNLIEKQQQLIELLKEKRQAVISHAVTKGLNPDVPMKDSGVEWLGEVPAHWKLIKFSHCVSIRSGQVDPRKFPYCDYWLIAPNHIVSGEGRIINLETAKDQGADSGKYLCRTGEVIYSKIRPALVKACLSPSDTVLCSADMYPMTSYNGLTNKFLLLYLLSDVFTRFAVNQADRVAMPKINRESLSDCKIPVPPIDEQEKICSHAREALEKLDVLLQKSQLTIEIFQERRTALISAAVTGKIDIRDWIAPDTQDVEESQEATA